MKLEQVLKAVRGKMLFETSLLFAGLKRPQQAQRQLADWTRAGQWGTLYGRFAFKHVQTDFFYGFEYRVVSEREHAFVAFPEKALLDLVCLQPGGDKPEYLTSLRLQHLDQLDVNRLFELAQRPGKPKLERAAQFIADLAAEEAATYRTL
jgi:hypothetical protein